MTSPVKLYVYDLSSGMAKQLSKQLTGKQIDGIWHTSVVVFGKEVFYGQGINTTLPGRSHHGSPLHIIDVGETALDEETFNEYLDEMKQHYTADKYHLLDFNCNSFTNDCVGFLTGNSIPPFVKDLPTDFLSTPFGAALRPTIDAMYRRPPPGAPRAPIPSPAAAANASPNPQLAASILQAVAAQAQAPQASSSSSSSSAQPAPLSATQTLAAPMHVATNPAAFHSFVRAHRATVAIFTSPATCPPCRVIEPVFERLAEEKGERAGGRGAAFAKVDMDVGMGRTVASEFNIRVVPTFMFFLDGKKVHELKGADANELKTQIDLLIYQAYPPHPHTTLSLPAVQALSLEPILFTQVPALDTALSKLTSFIDAAQLPASSSAQAKVTLTDKVVPYLKARFATSASGKAPATKQPSASPGLLASWAEATLTLLPALPASTLFPLIDMWRLALLDPAAATWTAAATPDPLAALIRTAAAAVSAADARNSVLTALRLLANAVAQPAVAGRLLAPPVRTDVAALLVPALLHSDAAVRTAAASLAFNIAARAQRVRVAGVRGESAGGDEADEDWEVEMVSAVVEAIDREKASEDIVHRLTASLAFLLRLSPIYASQLEPLLEVLQGRTVLQGKLAGGGCGEAGVQKKEVRRLVEEVALKLCP